MSRNDPDQSSVYSCEDRLSAAIATGAPIRAFGTVWELEPEETFTTLAAAQLFATLLCAANTLPPVTVRHRAGDNESHYQPLDQTIALASWGATRTTICHELAHHATHSRAGDGGHGPLFRTALCELLDSAGAPQQAGYLRGAYLDAGLATARPL